MQIQPYLSFEGRCEEALAHYSAALGAQVDSLMRYRESPDPPPPGALPPGCEDKVMHTSFRVGDSVIMASDGRCSGAPVFQGTALSIAMDDAKEARRRFAALAEGGQILMPLGPTFWSPAFGMLTDRFGVAWMVNVSGEEEEAG